jgi:hypothetical protein
MNNVRDIKRKNTLLRPLITTAKVVILLNMYLLLVSCAPSLYSVNINYEPSETVLKPTDIKKKYSVTIATFNDVRPAGDDLLIGKVITSSGNLKSIIPKNLKPSKAVAKSLKDYMSRAGYTVTNEMPTWNLQEKTIKKEWGKILIGGNIDKLEIICNDNIMLKKYKAEVKLSLFFANVQTGKIFYIVSAIGTSSLEHVRFSEEILEQQINGALSIAIEKIFGGNTVQSKIEETFSKSP